MKRKRVTKGRRSEPVDLLVFNRTKEYETDRVPIKDRERERKTFEHLRRTRDVGRESVTTQTTPRQKLVTRLMNHPRKDTREGPFERTYYSNH